MASTSSTLKPQKLASEPGTESKDLLHITMHIDEEVAVAEPSLSVKIAFFLSFIPLLGYVAAVLSVLTLIQNHRQALKTHGLTYAALALQVFYTLLMLTALLISTQARLTSVVPTQASERTAQSFLTAIANNDFATAKSYMADSKASALDVTLPMYQEAFSGSPLLVESRTIAKPKFSDTGLQGYNGRPLSYQLWRVSSMDANSRYLIMLLSENTNSEWRIIQIQSLEAPGDSSAKSAIQQVVTSLVSQ